MIAFNFRGAPGRVDHARLVEDFGSMAARFRTGQAEVPLALLADVGGDLLYARRNDAGAWKLKRDLKLHQLLASIPYRRAFAGALRVSCLQVALALGRKDLHRDFVSAGALDLERAMKWLVLYGMDEHRLWRFVDARFVADLRRRAIETERGPLSPLDMILLHERADLRRLAPPEGQDFARALDRWIERDGVQEYRLFWTLDDPALARMAAAPAPGWLGKDFAGSLAAAHESGKADLFVGAPDAVARGLDGVSQLSPEAREAAFRPPVDEEVPGEIAPEIPPTPLTRDLVSAFDFLPGDAGLRATMTGGLGHPVAAGAPLLSPMTTFFFATPRSRRVLLAIEATLAEAQARLLVWIDGRPADLLPAAALAARPAKIHALRAAIGAPLTVGLEVVGGRQGGIGGHLRSLAILAHRVS